MLHLICLALFLFVFLDKPDDMAWETTLWDGFDLVKQ